MKRFFVISGCLIFLVGLFYESLPLELVDGLWNMFRSNSRTTYFRVVPSESVDYTQVILLSLGALLFVAGLLLRRSNAGKNP